MKQGLGVLGAVVLAGIGLAVVLPGITAVVIGATVAAIGFTVLAVLFGKKVQ